jgi:hypothetical protein
MVEILILILILKFNLILITQLKLYFFNTLKNSK